MVTIDDDQHDLVARFLESVRVDAGMVVLLARAAHEVAEQDEKQALAQARRRATMAAQRAP